uniref:Muscular LMNA-interacting protein isoform X2 n=1 Tax=Pogona vitticeps TaxID=103695 RepID=A0ABM5GFT5_9SAUR
MEVEKHNREASARDTLRKEKRKVPSESGFLRFMFVPTFGTLPTQFHVADTPAFLVGLEGEPADKNYQENARNRNKTVAEEQALGSGEKGKSDASGCINSGHSLFQPKEPHRSRQKMDRDDLFKAEFVFLTDSDEDTKTALGNGSGGERSKILETSCVSARGQENVPQLPLHPEPPYSPATQHKQSQLTPPLPASGHPSHTSPVVYFLSPTNLKVDHEVAPPAYPASSLQESYSQWQSANGSSIHQSSTYFHSTTSSSVPSSVVKRPSFPLHSLSDSDQLTSSSKANTHHADSEATSTPLSSRKDLSLSSQLLSSAANTLQSPSPRAHSPLPSKRLTTWSVVPISITAHVLSPSPKPVSSPLHGSSSTLCSANNPCSQMSSSGNLLMMPGGKSSLPTRLSLLTAILKSGSSPKRPFSPASCPATFSPNSLGSSTLTLDQKFRTTPPTPKKSPSSFSVRSTSPSHDECHLSVFSNTPNHTSLSSKSSPHLRSRSLSPKNHLDIRAMSPDKLRPLSPTISSYRKTVVSPLLHPKQPHLSLPPSTPRKGARSPAHRTHGPENLKKVHTYSPTFTAKSIPVSVSLTNPRDLGSYPSEKGCLSPAWQHSSAQPKERFPQASSKDPHPTSPTSICSPHWPFSHTDSTSPPRPDCKLKPSSAQRNSSSVHSNFRACPPSSRPRTPAGTHQGSPTVVHSPYSLWSRSRELNSPLSFSLPSDSENQIPQIRTSYKAFAAIPTNTLLLEQKALDEPTKPEALVEDKTLDTHSEMCSPAQLRQQTEELCAAIDQVLQDPLAKHQQDSSPRSLQNLFDSDVGKPSTALQRSAGRETRYANLYLSGPAATESQKTKPGVIRPTLVKAKIMVKEEEPIQPNPFKKYLEETSDPETEEDSSLVQPFPPTKPKPTTKSTLHPLPVSHADSLTPGPFNHLGSTFGDIHEYSYTPYQRNALYKKHTHPIVPIPENEALSSKEIMSERQATFAALPRQERSKQRKLSRSCEPSQQISLFTQRRPWE